MKTKEVFDILMNKYNVNNGYVPFWEFGMMLYGRAIDFLAVGFRYSNKYEITAFEIKVSKSDWYREKSDPSKRAPFVQDCNRFYFVSPKDIIPLNGVPEECGLMYVYPSGYTKVIKEAPRTEINRPHEIFSRLFYILAGKSPIRNVDGFPTDKRQEVVS